MSGGGGGSDAPSETTTTTRTEPPEYVKPYSMELMTRAGQLSNAPYMEYEGDRIAPFTDQHMMGLQMTQDRALGGNPLTNVAKSSLYNTMEGNYFGPGLSGNPYLGQENQYAGMDNPYMQGVKNNIRNDMTDTYQATMQPNIDRLRRQTGSFGNSGIAEYERRSLDDLQENIGQQLGAMEYGEYGKQQQLAEQGLNRNLMGAEAMLGRNQGAWNAERDQQMRAALTAPGMDTAYQDAQAMMGTGDIIRDYNQSILNYGYDNWNAAQQWPYQQLDVLANAIRTSMGGGGSSVTSSPNAYQSNSTANMLGGTMLGYGLGSEYNMPWLGAAGGGLLGSLI